MWDLLDIPVVQAILGVTLLLVAIYVGYRVIVALRPSTSKADTSVHDLLNDFEEMQLEGDINAQELRSIKALLGNSQQKR